MADQQFLASFGVDIDESGVSRLQKILAENRTLAESLSSAFDTASESVKAFREEVATDLPTLFSGSGYGNVTENLFLNRRAFRKETHTHRGRCAVSRTARVSAHLTPSANVFSDLERRRDCYSFL